MKRSKVELFKHDLSFHSLSTEAIKAQKEQALNVAVVKNPVYASDSEQEPIRKPTCDTVAVKHPVAER